MVQIAHTLESEMGGGGWGEGEVGGGGGGGSPELAAGFCYQ